MPITVKHGGGNIGGLAMLAAAAGGMQGRAPQMPQIPQSGIRGFAAGGGGGGGGSGGRGRLLALNAAADAQKRQIRANAEAQERDAELAKEKTAVAAGLGKEMQEWEYELEVEKLKEQAKIEAEQFETRYTAQQRQEIQRWNNADAAVEASPDFTEEEKEAWRRKSAIGKSGIKPSQIPADPNKMKYIEGQEPGKLWRGEGGGWHSTEPDGSVKLQIRPDQTPEYMVEQAKLKEEAAGRDRMQATDDARLEAKLELFTEKVDVFDKVGNTKTGVRGLNPEEIREKSEAIDKLFGIEPEPQKWWDAPENKGLNVTDADKASPPNVGRAQAFLRQYPGGPDSVPPDKKAEYENALAIYQEAWRVSTRQQISDIRQEVLSNMPGGGR